jgi:MerR family transcriptional regulator, light-induced transcriptional regulator
MIDEPTGLERLIDEPGPAAAEALELLLSLKPGLRDAYDDRMMRLAREDMAHHLRQFAAIVLARDGNALVDYLSWLKVLFDGLRIPDELVCLSFRCAGRAGAQRLAAEEAASFSECAERAAREYGRSEPASNRYMKEGLPENGLARAYLQALLEGRRDLALSLVESRKATGAEARRLYLELFQPAQRELGRLWQLRKISVAQEHFATAATQYVMSTLYPALFAEARPNGRRLIAACAQGEFHELGIRMVADFFQAEGWDARYLGADLPVSALAEEVARADPDLVALSASVLSNVRWTWRAIAAIREAGGKAPPVMVGGAPFAVSPELWLVVGADATALDCEEALRVGTGLVGAPRRAGGRP